MATPGTAGSRRERAGTGSESAQMAGGGGGRPLRPVIDPDAADWERFREWAGDHDAATRELIDRYITSYGS